MPTKPFDLDNTANAKLYVSEQVLERLATGEFRPIRERSNNFHLDDRRDRLSPLAISKRAIRYEPHVFFNRGQLVYDVAKCLNDPKERVLMIGGTTGIGKTSFVRGVIELMGGTPAQLLWFDVTPMTDVDQITRFMVEYLFYIYQSVRPDIQIDESISPIESLRYLIEQSPDQRILLVLDNAELLVTPDEHFRSKDLLEMMQFLLGFPNIKLLLSGTRLPLKDLKSSSRHWWLSPLTDEQLLKVLHMTLNGSDKKSDKLLVPLETLKRVVPLFKGTPEYAWVWMRLLKLLPPQRSQKVLNIASASESEHIDSLLLQIALENLTESQFAVAELLSLIRHGVTPSIMREVLSYCLPQLPMEKLNNIDQIVLGSLLKKVYPPQSVLTWLHKREQLAAEGIEQSATAVEPSYALVDVFAERIRERLSLETKAQLHQRLSSMYQEEKRKPILERILPVKTSYLMNEVEYHVQLSKLQQRFSNNPIFQRSRREARPLVSAIEDSISALESPGHSDAMAFDEHGHVSLDDIPIYSTDQLESKVTVLRTSSTSASSAQLPPERLVVTGNYSSSSKVGSSNSSVMPSLSADFPVFSDPAMDMAETPPMAFAEDAATLKDAPDGKLRVNHSSSVMPMTVVDEHIALARFYHFDGAYKEAQHHWQLALGLIQKSAQTIHVASDAQAEIYYALGTLYLLGKHNAHALYCFRRAINLLPDSDPRLGQCHFRLGTLFDEAGKLPKAMKHYVQSYKIHTKYGNTDTCATVLYNMAQIQAERGELEQAIRLLDDSIRLDFKSGNTQNAVKSLLALAELYQQAKNFGKLLETLEIAKRHSQQSPKLKAWIQQRLQQIQQRVDVI